MSAGRQQFANMHEHILDFGELADNWDGYGAPRIDQRAIDAALRVWAVPTVNGGVQIEWQSADGQEFVEFELGPDGVLSFCSASCSDFEWEGER